ncbi:MAG: LPS-assembly protein LptD [Bacteroidia bacterium]|nr:LPS-assembly protein LptD [Bacteroidia bacterium]MCZ2249940.1 LPS-assembly protein LptD [Bacteroidia bacterium]
MLLLCSVWASYPSVQHYQGFNDSLKVDSLVENDSAKIRPIKKDSLKVSKNALDEKVKYQALDSIVFDIDSQRVYMYGKAEVEYEEVNLKAGEISIDQQKNIVMAQGIKDSTGKTIDDPDFTDGSQNFKSKHIIYNTKTKKGKIKEVTTIDGESYLRGESVKKDSNDVTYMQHGSYTTCNLEHPHYYFSLSKLKVIPDDKIVTGPANLVIADIPTPLAVPFGFFPNKKGQAKGILLPTYGQANNYGFFLKDGGYYTGINEHIDLMLRGDIYTRGSWALRTESQYAQRYKYNGNMSLGYAVFKLGEEGFPNYEKRKDFFVRWNHAQDAKANPTGRFSADVNFGTSSYNKLNATNAMDILSNTFQSSIQYNKSFANSNLTVSARQSQNTSTHKFDISAPELTYAVNRFYPFKRKNKVGSNKWYEDIGLTYTNSTKAQISTYDTLLYRNKVNWSRDINKGMNHIIPLTTSIKLLKYFTLSPSATYSESWYLQSVRKSFDTELNQLVVDTMHKFSRAKDLNLNVSLRTIVYGMYQFKSSKIKAIRHVVTPNVGFTYNPGLSGHQTVIMPSGNVAVPYSIFEGSLFGVPSMRKSGNVNFGLVNNLEMKVKSEKDTISGFKKIKIFENLSLDSRYDVLADSFNLAPFAINMRTAPVQFISINVNAVADPYRLDPNSGRRVNEMMINQANQPARLTTMSASVIVNLKSKQAKPKTESKYAEKEELDEINRYRYQYIDFNIPWTLNLSYNYIYNRPGFKTTTTQTIAFNGDFNVTNSWKIGFSSNYDLVQKQFTYTDINVYRDLHCWEIRLNMVPFGFRKSYSIDINVKSSILQDLKLTRRRDWYDLQ